MKLQSVRDLLTRITLGIFCGASVELSAEVTRFEVLSTNVHAVLPSGTYVRLDGQVTGQLDSSEPIPDLENFTGPVAYQTDFILVLPQDPAQGNGTLVFDVENRGGPIAHTLYNSTRDQPVSGVELGTGFLESRGFTVAVASWELGEGITLPSFTDAQEQTRVVEAVGLAAVRDIVAYLKYSTTDSGGRPNPLNGSVQRAVGVGYSQTGRFLRTFFLHGFNMMGNQLVFDGMHVHAGHSGLVPIMEASNSGSSSAAGFPTFNNPEFPGVHVAPFTYEALVGAARDRDEQLPRIVVSNTSSDYYSFRASLARTGAEATAEQPIPANVRIYDIAGSGHIVRTGGTCSKPRAGLDWFPVMRALLLNLDEWIRDGTHPPGNRLFPLEQLPGRSDILGPPSTLPLAVIQVPRVDEDGTDLGGVRLPAVEAPLGTYAGQNGPLNNVGCTLSASFIPFAQTKVQRLGSSDGRLSIEERYPRPGEYARRVAEAAYNLAADRLLLTEDALIIVKSLSSAPILSIRRNDDRVTLRWIWDTPVHLEQSSTVAPGNWSPVPQQPVIERGMTQVQVPTTDQALFFRLSVTTVRRARPAYSSHALAPRPPAHETDPRASSSEASFRRMISSSARPSHDAPSRGQV